MTPAGNPRTRVLYGFPARPGLHERLMAAAPGAEIVYTSLETRSEVDGISDPDVQVLFADFVPADLSRTPRLRWVQYSGAGVDDLADERPWSRGVAFTTASGVNALPIGEYLLGTMLRVSQRVAERIDNQARRAWTIMDPPLRGRPLRGATLVVVGYGSIGREVARLASAFGMRILAVKRDPTRRRDEGFFLPGTGDPEGAIPAAFHSLHELPAVAAEADYLVVALPLTGLTRHIVGVRVLGAMRPSAWLINVGRGDLIDEAALEQALRAGQIAGAVIDVASREPLKPDDPLWEVPSLLITPHVAGAAPDPWSPLEALFTANLRRFAAGEPLLNVVHPEHGY